MDKDRYNELRRKGWIDDNMDLGTLSAVMDGDYP